MTINMVDADNEPALLFDTDELILELTDFRITGGSLTMYVLCLRVV